MEITRKSEYSGIERTIDLPITQDELDRWEKGEKIQDVFPYLDGNQREFLMTGITPDEWNEMFPPEDENKDEGGLLSFPAF